MSTVTPTEFFTAFHLRQACCQALLELSQRQAELFAADDYPDLIDVLQSKQSLLDHLAKLSVEQQPLQTAWNTLRHGFSADDRARCDAVLVQTEQLLADVLSSERSATQQLLTRRQATQRELQALSTGVQAQLAYQSRPPTIASRLDLDT